MHEHDGSGCIDCECSASPMNTWPCTCPSSYQMKDRTTLVGNNPIVQTVLWHPRFENGRLGEMTITQDGRHVTIELELDKEYTEVADHLNYGLTVWPNPAVSWGSMFKKTPAPVTAPDKKFWNCGQKTRHYPHPINQYQSCDGVPAGSYESEQLLTIPDNIVLGEN